MVKHMKIGCGSLLPYSSKVRPTFSASNLSRGRLGSFKSPWWVLRHNRQDSSCFLIDCKFFATAVTTNIPSTVDSLTSSKELFLIVYNEARRSLEVNLNQNDDAFESCSKTFLASPKDPNPPLVPKRNNLVMISANSLLEVSKDHVLLKQGIATSRFRRHVDVLHKAFLSLTSKCLDQASLEDPSAIQLALKLAERAGKIGLPIHTPLHRRIMETAAQFSPRDLPLMLNIGSLMIQNSPDVFASALQILIRNENYALAETLMEEMPIYLTRSGLKDVFNAIREACESGEYSVRRVSRLCRLVQHLELSVQRLIIQEHQDRRMHSQSQTSTESYDSLDAMGELLHSIEEYSRSTENGDLTDDDEEALPIVSCNEELATEAIDYAVFSILLSRIEDPRVKIFLADLVGVVYNRLSAGLMNTGADGNLEYFVNSNSFSSTTNHDAFVQHKLPDITDQLVRMNGGLELEFTNGYEDILFDEESRLDDTLHEEEDDFDLYDDYSSDNDA